MRLDKPTKCVDPSKVQKSKCRTCPFGDNPIGNRDLQKDIVYTVLNKSNHYCHSRHDETICRGSRDVQIKFFYRMGVLESLTDEAYKKALGGTKI